MQPMAAGATLCRGTAAPREARPVLCPPAVRPALALFLPSFPCSIATSSPRSSRSQTTGGATPSTSRCLHVTTTAHCQRRCRGPCPSLAGAFVRGRTALESSVPAAGRTWVHSCSAARRMRFEPHCTNQGVPRVWRHPVPEVDRLDFQNPVGSGGSVSFCLDDLVIQR